MTAHALERFRFGVQSDIVDAVDWFPAERFPELRRLEFKEEIMSLGMYGWVTLLTISSNGK